MTRMNYPLSLFTFLKYKGTAQLSAYLLSDHIVQPCFPKVLVPSPALRGLNAEASRAEVPTYLAPRSRSVAP